MIRFRCPCGKKYGVADDLASQIVRCKECGRRLTVPAFVPAAPVEPPLQVSLQPKRPKKRQQSVLSWVTLSVAIVVVGFVAYSLKEEWIPQKPDNPVRQIAKGVGLLDKYDPTQRIVVDHLIKYANDPKSVEIVEIWRAVPAQAISIGIDYDLAVYVVVRAKNAFGALVVGPCLACVKDGKVVHVLRDPDFWELNRLYNTPLPPDPLADFILKNGRQAGGAGVKP